MDVPFSTHHTLTYQLWVLQICVQDCASHHKVTSALFGVLKGLDCLIHGSAWIKQKCMLSFRKTLNISKFVMTSIYGPLLALYIRIQPQWLVWSLCAWMCNVLFTEFNLLHGSSFGTLQNLCNLQYLTPCTIFIWSYMPWFYCQVQLYLCIQQ